MSDTYHIMPTNDLKPHTNDCDYCKCAPRIENVEGGRLVVHNSWDGREFFEQPFEIEGISSGNVTQGL